MNTTQYQYTYIKHRTYTKLLSRIFRYAAPMTWNILTKKWASAINITYN